MANKVEIQIDGKNAGAVKAINGVEKKLIDLDRVASGVTRGMGSLGSMFSSMISPAFMVGAGLGSMVAGAAALIGKELMLAAALDKTAQKVGVSVEALSQYRYAADLADVSAETFEKGLKKMAVTVLDAQMGLKTAIDTFKVLGISLEDNDGRLKSNEVLLANVADKFKSMENGGLKTALAVKVFGRAGAELIPLLNEGADGLDEMRRKADEMGLTISTQTAHDAAALQDELTRMKGLLEGLAVKSLPWVTEQLMELGFLMDLISKGDFKGFTSYMLFDNTGLDAYKKSIRETADVMQDGADANKEIEDSLRRQATEAERLNKQWEGIGQKLQIDINTFGLDPQAEKLARLIAETENYHQKFDKIPGALSTINDYLLTQLFTIYKLNEAKGLEQGTGIPGSFGMDSITITEAQRLHDEQIRLASEVTEAEMMNYALRSDAAIEMYDNIGGALQNFAALSGNTNKTMFGIYKAYAMGQAAIATYTSAVEAYKAMVGIPIVGPGLAIAAAAAATAFGLSNIARIASLNPGSTGGGGIGGGSLSSPSASNIRNDNITNNNSRSVVVNVYGFVGMDKDAIARELVPALEKAWGDGVGNG